MGRNVSIFIGFVAMSLCVMVECWHRVYVTAGLSLVSVAVSHAVESSSVTLGFGEFEASLNSSSSFSMLWWTAEKKIYIQEYPWSRIRFQPLSLTVRFWMPSEKAPICLTVPSESSIWRDKNQLSVQPKQQDLWKMKPSVYIQWTSSPVQACQGHPHRSGAQSLSGSSVPLASPHPSDRRTPHSLPASSSSDCQSCQMTAFWAGVNRWQEKKVV